MDLPATAPAKAPYGLSFAVPDLVFVRDWARKRALRMEILVDQVMDGAEFEELILLRVAGGGANGQALSIWRTRNGIVAQANGGHPKLFGSVRVAAQHFATYFAPAPAAPRPSFWRALLRG